MTREILFRGKKHGNGGWAYGSLIVADDFCCILEDEANVHPMDYPYFDGDLGIIDGRVTPVIPDTVGQWTGLVNKNCVKIFEGDVVKYKEGHKFSYSSTLAEHVADGGDYIEVEEIVAYRNCEFTPRPMRDDCDDYWYSYAKFDFEVLGNIWDNPELGG